MTKRVRLYIVVLVIKLCLTLFVTPQTIKMFTETSSHHSVPLFVTKCILRAPLSMGFPRQKLEWVAVFFSRASSWHRDRTWVSCIGRQIVYHWRTWELCCVLVVQSCLTLCDLVDYSLPGSSVHGILQVRIRGVGCHFLFQGMFLTQGSNPGLLHCRQTL